MDSKRLEDALNYFMTLRQHAMYHGKDTEYIDTAIVALNFLLVHQKQNKEKD